MTYGIPTLMACADVEALTRFCAEHGFRFVEMNMTFPWFQPGSICAETLRNLMKDYGVGYTIHLHDQVNPFEFSPDLRRGSLENIGAALDLACELGLPRLNMHLLPGTYSSVNGTKVYLYEYCEERYLAYVREFQELVERRLRGTDTLFCIENTSGFKPFHHKAIDLLLASPVFGLTFDVGHNYRANDADGAFILSREARLRHFHIHDCDSHANHLGFGEGHIDLIPYLRLADRLGATVVVEVKESGALLRSRDYLIQRGLWTA